jgi:hypothetical protein
MVGKIAAYSHACGKHTAAEACAADKANYCRFNPNLSPSCDVDVSRAFTAQACGISFSGTPCVVYTAANAQCTSWPIENCPAPYCKVRHALLASAPHCRAPSHTCQHLSASMQLLQASQDPCMQQSGIIQRTHLQRGCIATHTLQPPLHRRLTPSPSTPPPLSLALTLTHHCPSPLQLSSGLCTIDTTTGAAPFFAGAIDSGSAFSKGILAAAAKCATFTKEQCAGTGAAAASAAASTAYLAFKPFVQDLTDGFVTTVGADGAFTLVKPAAVEGLPVAKVGEDEPAIIAPKPTNADGTPVQTSTSTGTGVTTTSTGSGSGSTSMVTDSTTKTGSSNLEAGKNSTNAAYTRAMAAGTLLAAAGAAVLLL